MQLLQGKRTRVKEMEEEVNVGNHPELRSTWCFRACMEEYSICSLFLLIQPGSSGIRAARITLTKMRKCCKHRKSGQSGFVKGSRRFTRGVPSPPPRWPPAGGWCCSSRRPDTSSVTAATAPAASSSTRRRRNSGPQRRSKRHRTATLERVEAG